MRAQVFTKVRCKMHRQICITPLAEHIKFLKLNVKFLSVLMTFSGNKSGELRKNVSENLLIEKQSTFWGFIFLLVRHVSRHSWLTTNFGICIKIAQENCIQWVSAPLVYVHHQFDRLIKLVAWVLVSLNVVTVFSLSFVLYLLSYLLYSLLRR